MKRMDTSVNAINTQIQQLEAQITAENAKMAAHSQAKHEETRRKLEEARGAVSSSESALEAIRKEQQMQIAKNEEIKTEGTAAELEVKRLQENIQRCEQMIARSQEAEKNNLAPYGKDIKQVLERVQKMKWVGDMPLGPLGVFVKAKNPKMWGDLLRNQLGSFLTAFAVTDARDRVALKSLLQQTGK